MILVVGICLFVFVSCRIKISAFGNSQYYCWISQTMFDVFCLKILFLRGSTFLFEIFMNWATKLNFIPTSVTLSVLYSLQGIGKSLVALRVTLEVAFAFLPQHFWNGWGHMNGILSACIQTFEPLRTTWLKLSVTNIDFIPGKHWIIYKVVYFSK